MAWFGGKAGAWVVDHSLDEVPMYTSRHGSIATIGDKIDGPDYSAELETPEERKARKRSHFVAYSTMFVMSVGFSIVLSGVWPYMKELDGTLQKSALGWVVAANPLGQMIASPLLGLWGNKSGSIRGALIASITIFIGGNIMYSTLYAFRESGPGVAYGMMILSRFIVGVSSANVTLCRSYLAGSTTLAERTTGIAIIAASQALGFVIGPGIQAVLTITMDKAITTGIPGLVFDKYTLAGWVAAALGLVNLIFVMPCIFQEYNIAEKERKFIKASDDKMKLPKADYIGIAGLLFAFFFVLFIYVLLETLAVPFVTDNYAVDDDFAMISVGIALVVGGVLSTFMFAATGYLSRVIDERKVMIFMGLLPTVIGTFLYFPWGNGQIVMAICNTTNETSTVPPFTSTEMFHVNYNSDVSVNSFPHHLMLYERFYHSLQSPEAFMNGKSSTVDEDGDECLGCPIDQEWCNTVPKLPIGQLLVAFVITMIGYPVSQALTQSLFSKMLGPRPQGLWMGVLTGVGSLSRVLGPIVVSYIYTNLGTQYTVGFMVCGMIVAFIELLFMYKRLVPMKIPIYNKHKGHDNAAAECEL